MNLQTYCKNCQNEINFSVWVDDRVELAKEKSENIELICKKCNSNEAYYVDSIFAIESKLSRFFSLGVFLFMPIIVIAFFWKYIGRMSPIDAIEYIVGIVGVSSFIYLILRKTSENKISRFNNYKLKGNHFRAKY